jgi:tRNA(adenine34) deaminase
MGEWFNPGVSKTPRLKGLAGSNPAPSANFMKNHEHYMKEALKEAVKAFDTDEVPVGAIIVHKGEIIAKAHNQIKTLKDPTAHAEIIAITQAANFLQNERLTDCVMYSTLEPCSMCAGAMVLSRIKSLIYAAKDPKAGAHKSVFKILNNKKLNHRVEVKNGILELEAGSLIKEFFKIKRKQTLIVT